MKPALSNWKLKRGKVVRIGGGLSDIVRLTDHHSSFTTVRPCYIFMRMNGSTGHTDTFFEASEEDLKHFLLNNQIPGMPERFSETSPEDDIERYTQELTAICTKIAVLEQYAELRKERERAVKNKASKASKAAKEQEALEMYEDVEVGDIVKIVGVRNATYQHRLVTEKGNGSFTGIQYCRSYDRKNQVYSWKRGDHMTTTMASKIRKVIKKEEHGIDFP